MTLKLDVALPTGLVATTLYSPASSTITEDLCIETFTGGTAEVKSGVLILTLFIMSVKLLPLWLHVTDMRGMLNLSMDTIRLKISPEVMLKDASCPLPSPIFGVTIKYTKPNGHSYNI